MLCKYLEEEIQNSSLVTRRIGSFHGNSLLYTLCLLLQEKHFLDIVVHFLVGQVDTELFREGNNAADKGGGRAEPLAHGAESPPPSDL